MTPSFSPSPSPSPSPSAPQCTASNCDTCDYSNSNCCEVCISGYTLSNNNCDCGMFFSINNSYCYYSIVCL